jgi:predicted permease
MADLIERAGLFEGTCGLLSPLLTVKVDGRVTQMAAHAMTGSCFTALGIRTALGRPLALADDRQGAAPVLVLSHDTWLTEFDGDRSVIGRTMVVGDGTFTIVGVAERGFQGLMLGYPEKLFIPFSALDLGAGLPHHEMPVELFAVLPAGANPAAMAARLRSVWPALLEQSVPARLIGEERARYLHQRVSIADASRGIDYSLRARFHTPLLALLALSALVLLITCVNVANLLLARAAQARRETMVRAALGASRLRVIGDMAAESAVLLVAGAAGALVLSVWIGRSLVALFKANAATFGLDVMPNARVLGFAGLVSLAAFAIFAVVPAWAASRADVSALASVSPRIVGGRLRVRQAVVVLQVALTVVLLTVGSTFLLELRRLQSEPLGLSLDGVLSAQLVPLPGGYEPPFSSDVYYPRLLQDVGRLPGVASVALTHTPVLGRFAGFTPVGRTGLERDVPMEQAIVSRGFFATVGLPLASGQIFGPTGAPPRQRTAVLSRSAARALFGDASAIGERIRVGTDPLNQNVEVIGVVADAVVSSPQQHNVRVVYLDLSQQDEAVRGWSNLLVRTRPGGSAGMAEALRRTVAGAGHEFVSRAWTLQDQRDATLSQERLIALVSALFALVGLTLAMVGLYGLMSFSVAQRTGEFGIRMALGATRRHIGGMVLRGAVVLTMSGVVLAIVPAWALNQVALKVLYARHSPGGASVAVAAALLLVTAVVAVLLPARRASSLDPLQALRRE